MLSMLPQTLAFGMRRLLCQPFGNPPATLRQLSGGAMGSTVSLDELLTVTLRRKLTTMYTGLLKPPSSSFFLFGPRGTGKTTWLEAPEIYHWRENIRSGKINALYIHARSRASAFSWTLFLRRAGSFTYERFSR